jgi:DNA-binding response OmpR family regulator
MQKKRILIVDDEASFTRLVKLNLEATNRYEVRVEKWPEDTLATASEYKPDLIILDIMMPRLFGGDVAERLRADAHFSSVPILFVSAAIPRGRVAEHQGVVAGFPLVAKPVTVEALIGHIEKQFETNRSFCCQNALPIREQHHEIYA